jgi:uncharacterized protein YydD (DUF2326 family)
VIYRIYSNMPTFKELSFRQGLNLILAEKSPGATERHTRNGAGKSSLTELIHFLMGASLDKTSLFRTEALSRYTFGIDFDLEHTKAEVERTGDTSSKVTVRQANTENWPIVLPKERLLEPLVIPNTQWRAVLSTLIFGLMEDDDRIQTTKFGPTFRSLFSYFVRCQSAGGFLAPMKQSAQQQLWDQQVAISYLLGLDWTVPQRWQQVREREKSLKELKKAAAEGTFGTLIGSTAELRTKLTLSEERARQLREHVSTFQVLPEYRNLEQEASMLTRELGTLADENTIDRLALSELQEALNQEVNPPIYDLERLYKEAGVLLPQFVCSFSKSETISVRSRNRFIHRKINRRYKVNWGKWEKDIRLSPIVCILSLV